MANSYETRCISVNLWESKHRRQAPVIMCVFMLLPDITCARATSSRFSLSVQKRLKLLCWC